MKLEMICTGEEVLSGQIVDTNAAWFADTMMNLGIELQLRLTVGDRLEDLVSIFRERSEHADLILVNHQPMVHSTYLKKSLSKILSGVNIWKNSINRLAVNFLQAI